MPRHDFQPGRLVAGLTLIGAAVAFGGDARGMWSVPWFAMVPIVVGGLCLAGAMGTVAYALRLWRKRPGRRPEAGPGSGPNPGPGSGARTGSAGGAGNPGTPRGDSGG